MHEIDCYENARYVINKDECCIVILLYNYTSNVQNIWICWISKLQSDYPPFDLSSTSLKNDNLVTASYRTEHASKKKGDQTSNKISNRKRRWGPWHLQDSCRSCPSGSTSLFLIRHLRHLPLPSSSGAGRDRKLMRRSTECCRLGREGVGRPGVEWQRAEAVQVAMNERQLLPTTGVRKWCSPAAPP